MSFMGLNRNEGASRHSVMSKKEIVHEFVAKRLGNSYCSARWCSIQETRMLYMARMSRNVAYCIVMRK